MFQVRSMAVAAVVAAAAVSSVPVRAATVVSDAVSFLAQVAAGSYLETFSGAAGFSFSLAFSGNGYSYDASAPNPNTFVPIGQTGSFLRAAATQTAIRINFSSGNVTAVGGEFFRWANSGGSVSFMSGPVTVQLSDGTSVDLTPASQAGGFRGFLSSVPILWLEMAAGDAFSGNALDNLRVGTAAPVPEPAAWVLMAGALGLAVGLNARGRRRLGR